MIVVTNSKANSLVRQVRRTARRLLSQPRYACGRLQDFHVKDGSDSSDLQPALVT